MNNKKVFKFRVFDFWQIGELESWFSDMAKKGLILNKVGLFVIFIKSEPQDIKYRIDISSEYKLTDDDKEIYKNAGWDYITNYGKFNVFSSPENRNADELHSDLQEQSYTLKSLDKMHKINAIIVLLLTIFIIFTSFLPLILSKTLVLDLIDNSKSSFIILMILDFFILYKSLLSFISVRKLRNNLLKGNAINHKVDWKKTRKVSLILNIFFSILLIMMIGISWHHLSLGKKVELHKGDIVPIVRIRAIEGRDDLKEPEYVVHRDSDTKHFPNKYFMKSSLLAPKQYESKERAINENKMWDDGRGV